jgi:hypothetical protein
MPAVPAVDRYLFIVMAGLDPAIHEKKIVDPGDKPGDDGSKAKNRATQPDVPAQAR